MILQGDCLEKLKTLEPNSVDALVTDPPYGIDYQSAWRTDKNKRLKKISNDKQPFIWWLHDAFKVVKDGGALVCFCRWDVQEAFRLAIEWAGFDVKSQVIWDREHHGMGDLASAFGPQHDVIWFATKGKFKFPSKRPKSIVRSQRISGDKLVHPNEKPVDLMAQLIRAVTPPGGTVLDPFAGSGATGVAAVSEGFKFIGIEQNPEYTQIAEKRIYHAIPKATKQYAMEGESNEG